MIAGHMCENKLLPNLNQKHEENKLNSNAIENRPANQIGRGARSILEGWRQQEEEKRAVLGTCTEGGEKRWCVLPVNKG